MSSSSENKPSSSSSPSMLKLFGFSLTASDDVGNRKIQCSFCHREFQNLQALGGHQNAHRRERQMSRLAQFEYMRLRQSNHIFQAVTPLVVPQGASSISVFGGATQFSTVPESSQKLPVAEPPGTLPVSVVQVPVIGVDDNNIDLELRLGTTSNQSGK